MELRELRYFRAVAEAMHFGRAAQRLGVAQPALSRQIQGLERELGTALFDRSRRQIQLTAAGKALLGEATRLLASADAAIELVRRAARGQVGRLTVGFVGSALYGPLPAALRAFRDRFPDIHLVIDEMETSRQRQALLESRIDVGVVRVAYRHVELSAETLLREPLVAALPDSHRLAGRKRIALSSLASEPFVSFVVGPERGYAEVVIDACLAAGFRPRVVQETNEMQTAIGLVAAGFGVCLAPSAVRRLQRPGVIYRPLAPPTPTTELVATYRRDNRSPALVEFLGAVRAEVRRSTEPGR